MEPAYAARIAKRIDSTFPHTSSILSELETQGLIESWPEGRIRYLKLTNRGKIVAEALQGLSDMLKKPGVDWQKLERLNQIATMATSIDDQNVAYHLGPLRRDLAKLTRQNNKEIRKAAADLDSFIVETLHK